MATHSGIFTWEIPCTEEPGAAVPGVAASWTRLSGFAFTFHFHHWRRKWQPTPGFLPGESPGRWSLVGCRLWGRTESDTTEVTQQQQLLSVRHYGCCCLVAEQCLTLCGPTNCSLTGSSVHGISQVRILEWVAISFSRGFSRPRNLTESPPLAGRFFTTQLTGKPQL